MKIMIADDHRLVAEAVCLKLNELGPNVEFVLAATVWEMLERATDDLDLALIDLNMPGAEGYAHLDALRQSHPSVPLVVLSGYAEPALIREALEHGAQGFIPKAYSPEIMLSAVRLVLAEGMYIPPLMLSPEPPSSQWGPVSAPAPLSRPAPLTGPAPLSPSLPSASPEASRLTLEGLRRTLTPRQFEVLQELSRGLPNKLIARSLGIGEGTVKIHLAAIFRVLKVRNRTEAVVMARALIDAGPAA